MVCSGMELLGFLLAVLAIAFVVAKVVFNQEVQKTKSTRQIRTPVFREPRSSDPKAEGSETPMPEALGLSVKHPKLSEPPLVETVEFDLDWYFGPECADKPSGRSSG